MVIAIFLIFPKSAKPEQIFFGTKRTCLWNCLNFRFQKIKMIECSGSWIKESLIQPNHLNTLILFTEIEAGNGDEATQNTSDNDKEISTYLKTL